MQIQTPRETNHEIITKSYTFSLFLILTLKSFFFHVHLNFLIKNIKFLSVSWTHFLKVIKQPFRRGVNLNRVLKKWPCYYFLIFFASQKVLKAHYVMWEKSDSIVHIFVFSCQFLQINSVWKCAIKLKIDMLYTMNNTFRNIVF